MSHKIILTSIFALCAISFVKAQSLNDYTQKLSIVEYNGDEDYTNTTSVEIRRDSSSTVALSRLIDQSIDEKTGEVTPASKLGYRIGIYFSNSASARAGAMAVLERCQRELSDLHTTMSYDNPYFKVSTGYCLSQEEAVMILHRVQKIFPRAYLMRENITPANIVTSRKTEVENTFYR
ncbi:MAG: hypothetical protein SNF68_01780 [Rikenellaceae bacterium]